MSQPTPLNRKILGEDLQIMSATLATIIHDVRQVSATAAESLLAALASLDRAKQEFDRAGGAQD
jgi:hypothetical protein